MNNTKSNEAFDSTEMHLSLNRYCELAELKPRNASLTMVEILCAISSSEHDIL